jgi:hypothetical protein
MGDRRPASQGAARLARFRRRALARADLA